MRSRLAGYAAALAMVTLVSVAISAVMGRAHLANISMLYLLAVLATAVGFGSGPAVLASVAAFLVFNYFFVEPVHTFAVAEPGEWVALLLFLATAVITGQLAASQIRRAEEARRREHEAVVLYDVARLMSESDLGAAMPAVAERLHRELGVAGVAIDLSGSPRLGTVISGDVALPSGTTAVSASRARILREGSSPTGEQRAGSGSWVSVVPPRSIRSQEGSDFFSVVPVAAGARRVGTITLARGPAAPRFGETESRLLAAVANQVGQAFERERLRDEALEAEVLRRSDELKTSLLNAVSHDLRTPLASIVASADSLRQQDVTWTADDRREFIETIQQEARRLNAIIENLLDFSRMESGALHPKKAWYDFGALVDDVLGRLRPVTAGHDVAIDIPEELPPIQLDYVEIDQVLSNLIENAAKYVPPGREIRISARQVGTDLEVEVADRGAGLSPTSLPRLFDPFYRDDGASRGARGSGLGLAIARGFVEAHGGTIRAENRPGGGARFIFTLPARDPVAEGGTA